MRATIEAEPSNSVLSNIHVEGSVIESDGAIITIMGDDGLTHKVIERNGSKLIQSGDGSRKRVRGVVENVEIQ